MADHEGPSLEVVARIYRMARKQGETQDRAVERCAEAYMMYGLADEARTLALFERAREDTQPFRESEKQPREPLNIILDKGAPNG